MAATSLARPTPATVRLIDHDVAGVTLPETLVRHSAPLTGVLTAELDGASESLRLSADEILLAALGRTLGRTTGGGLAAVQIAGRRSILLTCEPASRVPATDLLVTVHNTLAAAPLSMDEPAAMLVNFGGPVSGLRQPPCHALELRIYRSGGPVQLDWWYDIRRFYPSTVEELAEQFPLALIELCSESVAPILPEAAPSLICAAP